MSDPLHVRRTPFIGNGMRISREDLEDAGFDIGDDIPADAEFTLRAVWPEPGGDPLEPLRQPMTGLLGPLGLKRDEP